MVIVIILPLYYIVLYRYCIAIVLLLSIATKTQSQQKEQHGITTKNQPEWTNTLAFAFLEDATSREIFSHVQFNPE